jgi:hypothetical protein
MARLFARREKGISWTRTVLPTIRQQITQISEARKARANQVQRNAVVVLVVAKIAQSHQMVLMAQLKHQKVQAHVRQAR